MVSLAVHVLTACPAGPNRSTVLSDVPLKDPVAEAGKGPVLGYVGRQRLYFDAVRPWERAIFRK
jgi:hypothetical protein